MQFSQFQQWVVIVDMAWFLFCYCCWLSNITPLHIIQSETYKMNPAFVSQQDITNVRMKVKHQSVIRNWADAVSVDMMNEL